MIICKRSGWILTSLNIHTQSRSLGKQTNTEYLGYSEDQEIPKPRAYYVTHLQNSVCSFPFGNTVKSYIYYFVFDSDLKN